MESAGSQKKTAQISCVSIMVMEQIASLSTVLRFVGSSPTHSVSGFDWKGLRKNSKYGKYRTIGAKRYKYRHHGDADSKKI